MVRDTKQSKKQSLLVVAMLAALATSACSKSTTATGPTTGVVASQTSKPADVHVVTVTVDSSGFQPKEVSAAPGTNVIWIQKDAGHHAVVSGTPGHEDAKFKSPSLSQGASFTVVLGAPGSYPYFDQLHPSLTAQLVASAPGSTSPSAGKSP
jgi:plastocyanin